MKSRPCDHRRASSGVQASPAEMSVSSFGTDSGSNCASTEGVSVTAVMPCEASSPCNGAPGMMASRGARHRRAPASSVENTSATEASKPKAANCSTRLSGRTRWVRAAASAVLHRPRWASSVPLGRPVEPEVKMM
jgi:hypothetical protein